jgi:hypothetical protein
LGELFGKALVFGAGGVEVVLLARRGCAVRRGSLPGRVMRAMVAMVSLPNACWWSADAGCCVGCGGLGMTQTAPW